MRTPAILLLLAAALAAVLWVCWSPDPADALPTATPDGGVPSTESTTDEQESDEEPDRVAVAETDPLAGGADAAEPIELRGSLLLDKRAGIGARIDSAEVLAYAGDPRDEKLDFSRLMDQAALETGHNHDLALDGEPIARAHVEPDGHFALQLPGTRDVRLHLDHHFYKLTGTLPVHVSKHANEHDTGPLEVVFGGHILGRLVGSEPVEGATVRLVSDVDPMSVLSEPQMFIAHILQGGHTDTDLASDGTFEFRAVTPSPNITLSSSDGDLLARSDRVGVGAGETREVLLRAVPTGTIAVRVHTLEGEPIPDVRVRAIPLDAVGETTRALLTKTAWSDENGDAAIRGAKVGDYRVIVKPSDFRPASQDVTVGIDAGPPLEFRLDPGGIIRGRVVDKTGAPIENAGVALQHVLEIPMLGETADLVGADLYAKAAIHSDRRSDAEGRFEIAGVPRDEPVHISAAHEDYAPGLAKSARAGDELTIELSRLAEIRGRVVDRATGEPIPTFTARTVTSMMMFIERSTRMVEVRDSEDGAFSMRGVSPSKTNFVIDAEGYGSHQQRIATTEAQVLDLGTIELDPAARILGRVLSPSGEPVAGATVTQRRGGLMDNPVVQQFFGRGSVRSDADGNFELIDIRPGGVRLRATARGYASADSKRLKVRRGEVVSGIDLHLTEGGSIAGRVLLPRGRSHEGWEIIATMEPSGAMGTTALQADGTFRIDALDPGGYQVQAMDVRSFDNINLEVMSATELGKMPDVGALIRATQDLAVNTRVRVRAGETTEVELDASDFDADGIRLVGELTLGGAPLDSGLIEVQAVRGEQPRISQAFIQDGAFEIHRLRPGVVRLQLRSGLTMNPVGDPKTVEIVENKSTQRVSWSLPGGRIAGRVIDDMTGDPILGAAIKLQRDDEAGGAPIDFGFSLTDAEGKFAFEGLRAGTFTVIADSGLSAGKDSSGRLEGLRLGSGETLADLELRAQPGAGLEVRVHDTTGRPVSRALVIAVDGEGQPIGTLPIAMTNAEGSAWIAGLPAGKTRAVVRHDGFAPAFSELRTLEAAARAQLQVTLQKGTAVELEIHDADGNPLAGASVSVRWGESPWIPASLFGTATGSTIDLGQLPSGRCEFMVSHPRVSFTTTKSIVSGRRVSLVLLP